MFMTFCVFNLIKLTRKSPIKRPFHWTHKTIPFSNSWLYLDNLLFMVSAGGELTSPSAVRRSDHGNKHQSFFSENKRFLYLSLKIPLSRESIWCSCAPHVIWFSKFLNAVVFFGAFHNLQSLYSIFMMRSI